MPKRPFLSIWLSACKLCSVLSNCRCVFIFQLCHFFDKQLTSCQAIKVKGKTLLIFLLYSSVRRCSFMFKSCVIQIAFASNIESEELNFGSNWIYNIDALTQTSSFLKNRVVNLKIVSLRWLDEDPSLCPCSVFLLTHEISLFWSCRPFRVFVI